MSERNAWLEQALNLHGALVHTEIASYYKTGLLSVTKPWHDAGVFPPSSQIVIRRHQAAQLGGICDCPSAGSDVVEALLDQLKLAIEGKSGGGQDVVGEIDALVGGTAATQPAPEASEGAQQRTDEHVCRQHCGSASKKEEMLEYWPRWSHRH